MNLYAFGSQSTPLDASPSSQVAYAQTLEELATQTARRLIIMVTALYLLFHIIATARWPLTLGGTTWLVTLVVAGSGLCGYALLARHRLAALLLWLAGLTAAIGVALLLFHRPEVSFFSVLLPLLAMATIGWLGALWVGGLVGLLLAWLTANSALPAGYGGAVLLGCAITTLISWVSAQGLTTALAWTFGGFAQAQANTDEARQHRAQLARLVKELDQAYYQLERSNAALVAARHAAEEAEHFKTEFVTNVSHELRTPLNLIVGYSELMMTSPESYAGVPIPGPYRIDLNAVHRSAQHLLALVDDILDLARIEVGRLALAREEVAIDWLINDTVGLVRDYVTAKGLNLQMEIASDLPPAWIDRLRIRQVLLNLLVNAARHTEQGFVRVSATTQATAVTRDGHPATATGPAAEILICVQDSGRGISKSDLQKIFTEFRTTDAPFSQWHSGAGLGLPISKKFVELHQGRMGVESSVGEGTSFWFTLPTVTSAPPDQSTTDPERYHPLVRLNAVERIVIVVHPDGTVANLLKRYLTGYQVLAVTDPEAGLAKGLDLAHEVKALAIVTSKPIDEAALPDHAANVLLFHCALPDTRQVVSQFGVDNVLIKPVGHQELLDAVDALELPLQRILIVDDEPEVVRLFRRILRARVPMENCLEAYNGREALALLHQRKPDLVLLDLMMPEVDGRALLAQMAADPALAAIPVILISARGQDQENLHVAGPVQVIRPAGQELGQVIQLLALMLDGLTVGWQQLATNGPTSVTTPLVAPASADTRPHPATGPDGVH